MRVEENERDCGRKTTYVILSLVISVHDLSGPFSLAPRVSLSFCKMVCSSVAQREGLCLCE